MADQPQYTGATYAAEYSKLPDETLSEYLMRLAKLRSQGILGGGGMLDVKEVPVEEKSIAYTPKLGQMVINAGSGSGDSNNTMAQSVPISEEQRLANAIDVATGRDVNIPAVLGFFGGPIGKGIDALATYDRNKTIDEALSSRAYTDEQKERILNDRELMNELLYAGNLSTVAPEDTNRFGVDTWNIGTQITEGLGSLWNSITGTEDSSTPIAIGRTWAANPMPQLPTVIGGLQTPAPTTIPTDIVGGMFGNELGNRSVSTYTDSGTGTEYSVVGNADYTEGSWDTSGGGTKADGSYDISGWFN